MEATPTLVINYFSGFKQDLVPLFQRPYTWKEKQWRTLWEDVMVFYPTADVDEKATGGLPPGLRQGGSGSPGRAFVEAVSN